MSVIDTNSNTIHSIDMLLRRGVTAIGRYYRKYSHPDWALTKAEAQKLSQAGIKIFAVHEETGRMDFSLTKEQGQEHGLNALLQADQIGQPQGTAIYFALEGLPNGYKQEHLPAIRQYFEGVKASIGEKYKLGVYSDGIVCSTLLTESICAYTWLSASMAFEGTTEFYRSGRWNLAQKTPLDQTWGISASM
jgi:hypothetical protein